MARSKLTNVSTDLIQDSGSVLFSYVQGEQSEESVVIEFIAEADRDYQFEAVVIEAANEAGQTSRPLNVEPGGIQTTLEVRVPSFKGLWDAGASYSANDLVFYENAYYCRVVGLDVFETTPPAESIYWELSSRNTIYLRFPKTLGKDWAVQPDVGSSTYGFFELRVTEPDNVPYPRTWKPVRGMVELLFSPTDSVPDLV